MQTQHRGDELRSERFLRMRDEVEKCLGTIANVHAHRVAIYVLRERVKGMSISQVAHEAASATNDHAMLALRWVHKRMQEDEEFAQKVRRLCDGGFAQAGM